LFDHLNGKTSYKKIDPPNVLTDEEDVIIVAWTLNVQKHGMFIPL
jgi:hypothetical protein